MDVASHFNMTALPFAAGPRPLIETPGVVAARAELMDLLAHGTTLVFVESAPGSGKSALLRSVAGKLLAEGRHVRFCDTPAKLNEAGLAGVDFLIIDEAGRLPPERFRQLAENAARRHRVVVAAISPETAEALHLSAPVVTVRGLAAADTESFLRAHLERAGASDFPFSKAAIAGLAEASGGSVRALKALAGAALVEAMVERESTVTPAHVEHAVTEFRGSCNHVTNGHPPPATATAGGPEPTDRPRAETPPSEAPAPPTAAIPTPDPAERTHPAAAPAAAANEPLQGPSPIAARQEQARVAAVPPPPASGPTQAPPPSPAAAPPPPPVETTLPMPEPLEASVQAALPAVVPPGALPVLPASALRTPLPHPLRRAAQILPLAAAGALVAAVTLMWSQDGNPPTPSSAGPRAERSAEASMPNRAAAPAAATASVAVPPAAEAAPDTPQETTLAAASAETAPPSSVQPAPTPDKRVVIRYSEDMENGAEQAYALAGRLERDGWTVGEVDAVSGPIAKASIRHFSRGDAAAAAALDRDLASALPAAPVEFVANGASRRPGTIEVWIPEI